MTKPKISAIIPIYNVEATLEKCIDSVLNQTLPDIEIILVNDGSTDKSPEIAERYARQDSRIKLIHQQNGGLSDARNTGLKIATGEYISFVDSDDWIEKNMYEELIEFAEEYNNPNIVRIHHYTVTESGTNPVNSFYYPNKDNRKAILANNLKELMKTCSHSAWSGLWKKSFLDKHNLFFIKDLYHEDVIFTWKAMIHSKEVLLVFKPYYYYNLSNPSSITQSINNKFLEFIENFKLQKKFMIEQNIYKEFEYTYQTKACIYFNSAFKRALKLRGIRFYRYPELKKFFSQMHEISKDWDADKIDFENTFDKQKFLIVQENNFIKYLINVCRIDMKIKALWLYVIKNDLY